MAKTSSPETKGFVYSKTCVKRPLSKRPKIGFKDFVYFVALCPSQQLWS